MLGHVEFSYFLAQLLKLLLCQATFGSEELHFISASCCASFRAASMLPVADAGLCSATQLPPRSFEPVASQEVRCLSAALSFESVSGVSLTFGIFSALVGALLGVFPSFISSS